MLEEVRNKLNDAHITDDEIPDPDFTDLKVHGWHLAIRPVPIRSVTKGGIILADQTQDDIRWLTNVGRVVKVGPLCYDKKETYGEEPWCKEGDFVVIPKFTGAKFNYRGVRLTLIKDKDILMTINDPEDVDPMFNISKGSV